MKHPVFECDNEDNSELDDDDEFFVTNKKTVQSP